MNRHLPLILIVALLIAFRVAGSLFPETLPNFSPLAAVFFCGALLAPGWRGLAIPFGIWAVTFPLGVGHTANPMDFATTLTALITIFFFGKALAHQKAPARLVGSAFSAVAFHVITCGGAWLTDPLYAKTVAGLYQSVWSGPVIDGQPSALPSWVFLRNLTAANVLFTGLFLLAQVRLPKVSTPVLAFAKTR
jgi:hypothetical protein